MKLDGAMRLHAEMLAAVSGEELSAVIQLHSPYSDSDAQCGGCRPDDYGADWDDCATLQILNAWMHVEGYPVRVADPPPTCTMLDSNYCPVCGRCTCRNATGASWIKVPGVMCPLHGRGATHADGKGTKF